MIAHVFEREGAELALGNSRHAEVEPGAIVLALHVRGCVARKPEVEAILQVAALRLGQISAAKFTAEDNV